MKQKPTKMKMKTTMCSMMAFALLMLHRPNYYTNAESDNPLCDRISNGRIDQLNLQSFTYLDGKQDKVYLMEGNQFYEMSNFTSGGSSITLLSPNLWWSSMMSIIETASGVARDLIDAVTVVPRVDNPAQGVREYSGIIRTRPDHAIYAVPLKRIVQEGIVLSSEDVVSIKEEHLPHLSIIPKNEDFNLHGYVLQDDQFHNTNSSVMYHLEFDASNNNKKPQLATIESQNAFTFMYLVASRMNPDQVILISTRKPNLERALRAVKASPLLHKTPIGFITKAGTLYLIEPVIGCVYIMDAFPTANGEMRLIRKPIEQFFKCEPSNSIDASTNELLKQRYPPDRCDSVAKVQHFFDNPPTPPQSEIKTSLHHHSIRSEEQKQNNNINGAASLEGMKSAGSLGAPAVVGVIVVVVLLVAAAIGALMYSKGRKANTTKGNSSVKGSSSGGSKISGHFSSKNTNTITTTPSISANSKQKQNVSSAANALLKAH